jgi:2'-5' RNA ligase
MKRLFVAIPFPPSFVRAFASYEKRHLVRGVRWIPGENRHITLYFLGEVDKESVPEVRTRLREAIADQSPFSLEFQKIDFGPPNAPPRMVWAYFSSRSEYRRLVEAIAHVLKPFVRRVSRKEMIPHVTLARFKEDSRPKRLKLDQPLLEERTFRVSTCELVESELTPAGSRYTILDDYAL